MSPFGGQGIKQVGGFGGNGGGFGQQSMNQPNQFGPQSGGFGGGQQSGGFNGMGGGFGGQQGFGGGFGQQQQQYNPYQQQQFNPYQQQQFNPYQQQQYNPYQQQQQYNPYQQQQQYNPYQQQQYNPYQQQPQQYNPFPYQQPPQQQQFNPYQQQFNPYQQFGYGQRQQMENPYQRQQQQFMNRGQDRGGFDDRGGMRIADEQQPGYGGNGALPYVDPTEKWTELKEGEMGTMGGSNGYLGSSTGGSQDQWDRGIRPSVQPVPAPAGKASIQDMMNSIVGLGSDPTNNAGYTMQDIQNAQRAQATPTPARSPMQPPFNPYQQFNYGGGSDPRGRGGYKNDRNYTRMPEMRIPERNPDGTEMARWDV